MPTRVRRALGLLALVPVSPLLAIVAAHWRVRMAASGRVFTGPHRLPFRQVGLVLGVSPRSRDGRGANPHFEGRIAAAARLYHCRGVRQLLLSGNCNGRGYDEPRAMRAALGRLGVPPEATLLDGAGFRTLDSMLGARDRFGLRHLTVVTDPFHCPRAVFLARACGIDARAYASAKVPWRRSWKGRLREYLADVKACLDVCALHARRIERSVHRSAGASGSIGA